MEILSLRVLKSNLYMPAAVASPSLWTITSMHTCKKKAVCLMIIYIPFLVILILYKLIGYMSLLQILLVIYIIGRSKGDVPTLTCRKNLLFTTQKLKYILALSWHRGKSSLHKWELFKVSTKNWLMISICYRKIVVCREWVECSLLEWHQIFLNFVAVITAGLFHQTMYPLVWEISSFT